MDSLIPLNCYVVAFAEESLQLRRSQIIIDYCSVFAHSTTVAENVIHNWLLLCVADTYFAIQIVAALYIML